jgi:hypothetical protein
MQDAKNNGGKVIAIEFQQGKVRNYFCSFYCLEESHAFQTAIEIFETIRLTSPSFM